ncbi:hypothetical protein SKAU_G00381060 [Synaphobranchus kaupii]|uniref:Uncharacterized protein n=1 Tax=Synaphobranchus kaupii TaxID=118154 RepID=A0A9Q1IEP9_SYNKA|nr:hypothetical protein SKAU_G00381060 [Synaphobranchus kaupii]
MDTARMCCRVGTEERRQEATDARKTDGVDQRGQDIHLNAEIQNSGERREYVISPGDVPLKDVAGSLCRVTPGLLCLLSNVMSHPPAPPPVSRQLDVGRPPESASRSRASLRAA